MLLTEKGFEFQKTINVIQCLTEYVKEFESDN